MSFTFRHTHPGIVATKSPPGAHTTTNNSDLHLGTASWALSEQPDDKQGIKWQGLICPCREPIPQADEIGEIRPAIKKDSSLCIGII